MEGVLEGWLLELGAAEGRTEGFWLDVGRFDGVMLGWLLGEELGPVL